MGSKITEELLNKYARAPQYPSSVLIGSINPYSYLGHSQRLFFIAQYFAKRGIKVTWMNSPSFTFFHNFKFITSGNISRHLYPLFLISENEVMEDVVIPVYDSWALPMYNKFAASLYITRILQKIYSTILFKQQQFDVFIFDSPIFADFAVKLKNLHNTLIVYDSPDDYFAYSELSKNFNLLEKDIVNVSDIVITPTQSIRKKILSRNKDLVSDVYIIPNGVPKSEIAKYPSRRNSKATPRIGFLGTLGSWVDINLILDIAMKMPNCEFVIAGDGPNFSYWKKRSPSNCKFIGRVSITKRSELISSFDVGLIPFKRISLADSAFPLKLLEYFARGVPVVSSTLLEMKNIAEGFIYFADRIETWVDQINNAVNDPYDTKLSYIEFASKYTWEHTSDLLLELLFRK